MYDLAALFCHRWVLGLDEPRLDRVGEDSAADFSFGGFVGIVEDGMQDLFGIFAGFESGPRITGVGVGS